MEAHFGVGLLSMKAAELSKPTPIRIFSAPHYNVYRLSKKSLRVAVFRRSLPGSELAEEDLLHIFLKERQLSGDFISKASDLLWRRDDLKFVKSETNLEGENLQQFEEVMEDENDGGFLKLTKTQEWVSGDNVAPVNRKLAVKELQNDREKRKRLGLLRYDALKKELLLLTTGIGAACSGYCLTTVSVQAAVSYAAGVLFRRHQASGCQREIDPSANVGTQVRNLANSCFKASYCLQLLYRHTDNISRERVPQIFMQKKPKKIGIRSGDLKDAFERTVKGSTFALSSPRLVIPGAIYGFWGLSHQFFNSSFDFQLVPAMLGLFAYKAAALVQVYRDNEGLLLIFPDNEESPND